MKVLVGVPVFRIPSIVTRCVDSVLGTPAKVLVIDNNSDVEVKDALKTYGSRVDIITNTENKYCNGAWNQILEYGLVHKFDLIGLGTDANLRSGWYSVVTERALHFTDEILVPRLDTPSVGVEYVTGGMPGYFSFIPRKAAEEVYPIPNAIKHWYGDQYIFDKVRDNHWKVAILGNFVAHHEFSRVTVATPEAYSVIEQDKVEWEKLQRDKNNEYNGLNFSVV